MGLLPFSIIPILADNHCQVKKKRPFMNSGQICVSFTSNPASFAALKSLKSGGNPAADDLKSRV
jgi:hypothetical protein